MSRSRGKKTRSAANEPFPVGTRTRSRVEAFVRRTQSMMHLSDWTITVDWDQVCAEDALATITPHPDSRHATIRLSPDLLKEPPSQWEFVLTHELVHCYFFALHQLAMDTVSLLAKPKTAAVFSVAFTSALESSVDGLTDALVTAAGRPRRHRR